MFKPRIFKALRLSFSIFEAKCQNTDHFFQVIKILFSMLLSMVIINLIKKMLIIFKN